MKKIFLLICLTFLLSTQQVNSASISDYIDKPYAGMAYSIALKQDIPFLLIFAEPSNAIVLLRLMPLVNMVYNDYKGLYNFCIINTSVEENNELVNYFAPKKLPALYLIDTQNMTYTLIESKYYNKNALNRILKEFKKETLITPQKQ